MTVKIVIDTTACLPRDYIAAHKLPLIPQIIIFGEESFRDDTEIDLTRENTDRICQGKYAFKVLMVLGRAAEENPHIRIKFAEEEPEEDA